jgi:ATP-binding protein involved in chromosome partitioning
VISESVANRIVVFSGKGGVGKTTVAVNLACMLSQRSYSVGLLDADITGPNVLKMMGIDEAPQAEGDKLIPHERHNIRVVSLASLLPPDAAVIWRGPMRSKALEQLLDDTEWGDMNTLIMDLPPGTGDEALTIAQQVKPQLAIVVTTPQEVALLDARRAIDFARKLQIPTIALVENMSGLVCTHCGEMIDLFGRNGGKVEAERQDLAFLGAIPIAPAARVAGDSGQPYVLSQPNSGIASAFAQIASKVEELLQEAGSPTPS